MSDYDAMMERAQKNMQAFDDLSGMGDSTDPSMPNDPIYMEFYNSWKDDPLFAKTQHTFVGLNDDGTVVGWETWEDGSA